MSHLAPFREGPGPYLVLARNAIAIAGVWMLGWSAQQAALLRGSTTTRPACAIEHGAPAGR